MIIKSLIVVLTLTAISCRERDLKFISSASYPNLKEQRLGQSSYFVKFPANMFIEEAKGKEGQLGYGLWLSDSIKRFISSSGFIEIEPGRPIGGGSDSDGLIDNVRSPLLNGTVKWKISKTETGWFTAVANKGKLTMDASSSTRAGIDSMIAIIATLSSR
jgi:hypothetical protein